MPGQSSVAIVGQQVQRCRERLGLAATCQPSVEETSPVEADGRIIGWVAARSAERIHLVGFSILSRAARKGAGAIPVNAAGLFVLSLSHAPPHTDRAAS